MLVKTNGSWRKLFDSKRKQHLKILYAIHANVLYLSNFALLHWNSRAPNVIRKSYDLAHSEMGEKECAINISYTLHLSCWQNLKQIIKIDIYDQFFNLLY